MPLESRSIPAAPPAPPREAVDGLLLGVAHGDHDAFEALYALMSAPVYGLVRRVLRDPAQSAEIAQEAFLQVWGEANRFDPEQSSAASWILMIARCRAVDRVRSEESLSARHARLASRAFEPPFDCVAEQVIAHGDAASVRRCLSTIGAPHRESLLLAYYGGYTQREVAEHLGIPLGTVKTRIRDGMARLRDCLGVTVENWHPSGRPPPANTGQ